jgi:hypothetical protein
VGFAVRAPVGGVAAFAVEVAAARAGLDVFDAPAFAAGASAGFTAAELDAVATMTVADAWTVAAGTGSALFNGPGVGSTLFVAAGSAFTGLIVVPGPACEGPSAEVRFAEIAHAPAAAAQRVSPPASHSAHDFRGAACGGSKLLVALAMDGPVRPAGVCPSVAGVKNGKVGSTAGRNTWVAALSSTALEGAAGGRAAGSGGRACGPGVAAGSSVGAVGEPASMAT